jgi:hypothetical protein
MTNLIKVSAVSPDFLDDVLLVYFVHSLDRLLRNRLFPTGPLARP